MSFFATCFTSGFVGHDTILLLAVIHAITILLKNEIAKVVLIEVVDLKSYICLEALPLIGEAFD